MNEDRELPRRTLYLCGAGNSEGVRLALRLQRTERRWKRILLLDDDPATLGRSLLGIEVVGPITMLAEVDPATSEAASLVARTTKGRAAVARIIRSSGVPSASMVHSGVDTFGAETGTGVVVYENAILGPETYLGDDSVVFMGGIVGHEARVGRSCVIASGAVLNARVELEDEVYVGTNASVLPEIRIGRGATIGANTAVIDNVPAGATVIGVPGRALVRAEHSESVEGVAGGDDRGVVVASRSRNPAREEEVARVVADVFRDVLPIDSVSSTTNFFTAGGTSLLALLAVERIRSATGIEISSVDLFQCPTTGMLSCHLVDRRTSDPRPSVGRPSGSHSPRAEVRRRLRGSTSAKSRT